MKNKTEQKQVVTESEEIGVCDNLENNLTGDDLQKVFRWSPTQIKKIDQFLKRRLNNLWPNYKINQEELYQQFLVLVTKRGEGYKLKQAMAKLDSIQPKNKQSVFNLGKRITHQVKKIMYQVDREKAEEFKNSKENPIIDLLQFLSENDKPEYQSTFYNFMTYLDGDNNDEEDEVIESCENVSSYPWSEIREEISIITNDLKEIVQMLSIGVCDNDEQAIKNIRKLKEKGGELKRIIIESAENSGFTEDKWKDLESFNDYCEKLEYNLDEQKNENINLTRFYEKLIEYVENIEVVHRLPRKQKEFNESLTAIIRELRVQVNSDCPNNFPYIEEHEGWFEWAFKLEGAELEALINEIDENFPVLANFIVECQWDLLRPKKKKEVIKSDNYSELDDSRLEKLDKQEDINQEGSSSGEIKLNESDLYEINDEQIKIDIEDKGLKYTDNSHECINTADGENSVEYIHKNLSDNETDLYEESKVDDQNAQDTELKEKETSSERSCLPEEEFVAKCIAKNEISKAYWVVRSCNMDLSANLIGAFALGSQIGIGSAIPGELQGLYSRLVTENFSSLYSKLFLFGAIAGVAIFAEPPSGKVSTLLSFVDTGIKHLDSLVSLIKSNFLFQGAVRAEDLNMVLNKEDQALAVNRLKESSIELLNRIRNTSLSYEPGNILLRQMYQEGAEFTNIHRAVENNDYSKISFVRNVIKNRTGEEIVSEAHKLGIKKIVKPFIGNAKNQVIRKLNETLSLGREWLNLSCYDKQKRDNSLQHEKLIQLKRTLKNVISDLGDVGHEGMEKTASEALKKCLIQLLGNLNGEIYPKIKPLSSELIAELHIELDDDFEINENSKNCLLQNFSSKIKKEISEDNIKLLFDRNEFIRAKVLIDTHAKLAVVNDYLHERVDRLKSTISSDIKALNDMVEDAYLLGQLVVLGEHDAVDRSADSLRSELIARLNKIEKQLEHSDIAISWRIRDFLINIDKIKKELNEISNKSQAKVQKDFTDNIKKLPLTESGREDKEYIEKAFAEANSQGDNIAAFELLNRVKLAISDNTPIPRATMGANEDFNQFVKQLPAIPALP
jgi:hypothetical protein